MQLASYLTGYLTWKGNFSLLNHPLHVLGQFPLMFSLYITFNLNNRRSIQNIDHIF